MTQETYGVLELTHNDQGSEYAAQDYSNRSHPILTVHKITQN